jgi:hypothetical protein
MSAEFVNTVRVLKMGDDAADGNRSKIALGVLNGGRTNAGSLGPNRRNASITCSSHQNASYVIAADVSTGRFHHRTSRRRRHGYRAQTDSPTDSYHQVHVRARRVRLRRASGVPYSLERWFAESPQHGPITTSLLNDRHGNWIDAKTALQDMAESRQRKTTDQDITVSLTGSWVTNFKG